MTVPSNLRHRELSASEAWAAVCRGEAAILDLRTELERRRYGWPPGSRRGSLVRHVLWPRKGPTIYLCQHANRSRLTRWRGAAQIAGGWPAWQQAQLPIERRPLAGMSSR
jgi:rhodanese-related sulfurtransferase